MENKGKNTEFNESKAIKQLSDYRDLIVTHSNRIFDCVYYIEKIKDKKTSSIHFNYHKLIQEILGEVKLNHSGISPKFIVTISESFFHNKFGEQIWKDVFPRGIQGEIRMVYSAAIDNYLAHDGLRSSDQLVPMTDLMINGVWSEGIEVTSVPKNSEALPDFINRFYDHLGARYNTEVKKNRMVNIEP